MDVLVIGERVDDFPAGIGEAFKRLMSLVGDSTDRPYSRSYYGIFRQADDGTMTYYATVEEREPAEAAEWRLEKQTVPKGNYVVETLTNWRSQTGTVSGIFKRLSQTPGIDPASPGIEWYPGENVMYCMLKLKE